MEMNDEQYQTECVAGRIGVDQPSCVVLADHLADGACGWMVNRRSGVFLPVGADGNSSGVAEEERRMRCQII